MSSNESRSHSHSYVRKKQKNTKTSLDAKLKQLRSAATGDQDVVVIADTENLIDDVEYQQGQAVPYNLTDSERLEYSNESKSHSNRVATLEKHRGNVYALIYGQCTQILQDKMKQDKNWTTVSVSYKPLELYKLIERVILKQTEDQYPVAVLWEQLCNITNAKQGQSAKESRQELPKWKSIETVVGTSRRFQSI